MPIFFLGKSKRKNKKFYVRSLDTNKSIHFGDSRMEDYTIHRDELRKSRYLSRTIHQPWRDVNSPAFWSRNLLWNKQSLDDSIKDVKKRFGIDIKKIKRDF